MIPHHYDTNFSMLPKIKQPLAGNIISQPTQCHRALLKTKHFCVNFTSTNPKNLKGGNERSVSKQFTKNITKKYYPATSNFKEGSGWPKTKNSKQMNKEHAVFMCLIFTFT